MAEENKQEEEFETFVKEAPRMLELIAQICDESSECSSAVDKELVILVSKIFLCVSFFYFKFIIYLFLFGNHYPYESLVLFTV